MKEIVVQVCNIKGLHARPSAHFSSVAKKYECRISVSNDDRVADGKSIMGLLTLAASYQSRLKICLVGPQAEEAAAALLDQCKETMCLIEEKSS